MPVNWGSISGQFASLGLTNLSKEALKHGADAEQRRKEEHRYAEEIDRKLAEHKKMRRQADSG